jgi:hypothetical protein
VGELHRDEVTGGAGTEREELTVAG